MYSIVAITTVVFFTSLNEFLTKRSTFQMLELPLLKIILSILWSLFKSVRLSFEKIETVKNWILICNSTAVADRI